MANLSGKGHTYYIGQGIGTNPETDEWGRPKLTPVRAPGAAFQGENTVYAKDSNGNMYMMDEWGGGYQPMSQQQLQRYEHQKKRQAEMAEEKRINALKQKYGSAYGNEEAMAYVDENLRLKAAHGRKGATQSIGTSYGIGQPARPQFVNRNGETANLAELAIKQLHADTSAAQPVGEGKVGRVPKVKGRVPKMKSGNGSNSGSGSSSGGGSNE